jgi:hypothetical protein
LWGHNLKEQNWFQIPFSAQKFRCSFQVSSIAETGNVNENLKFVSVGNQLDEKLMDDKVADVGKVNQIPQ